MSAKYKSPSFLLPNELNTSANPANDTGVNSLYSMDFDSSSSDYINTDLSININSFSVSCWFKGDNLHTGGQKRLFDFADSTRTANKFPVLFTGSSAYGSIGVGKIAVFDFTTSQSISATWDTNRNGLWNHVVLLVNNTNVELYLNGSSLVSGTITRDTYQDMTKFVIGTSSNYSSTQHFNGQIDEVAIFNRALDSTEISALYDGSGSNIRPSNLMATDLNPIAYYPLGEQAQMQGYLGNEASSEWQFPNSVLQDYVMDFDGTNDYIDASAVSTTGDWSVSLWVNSNSTSYQTAVQLSNSTTTGTNDSLIFLYLHPGGASAKWGFYDGSSTLIGLTALNTNQWYHLVVTKSGTTYTLFLNGTQENQGTKANINIEDLLIGKRSANIFYMDGQMSNVQIFNSALPATGSNSVETIYNNGSPLVDMSGFTSLTNWWKLNADSVYTPSTPNYTTALSFNGTTDFIKLNSNTQNFTNFSLSFWCIKGGGNYKSIVGSNASNEGGILKAIVVAGGSIQYSDSTNSWVDISGGLSSTTWSHILITYNNTGNSLKTYKNGTLITTKNPDYSGSSTNAHSIRYIGARYNTGFFNKYISNVALFDSELTASQALTLFNFGTPETNISFNPTHWWKLDDQAAIIDYGSGGINGTNNGATDISSGVAVTPSWKIPSALPITSTPNYTTALDFNGSSDYIDTNYSITSGNKTISFWFNSSYAGYQSIMGNTSDSFILGYWSSQFAVPQGISYLQGSTSKAFAITASVTNEFADGNWHHFVYTYDGNSKIYIDGTERTISYKGGTTSSDDIVVVSNLALGLNRAGYPKYSGKLSNTSIWNTALTPSQVSTLFNNGTPETSISFSPISWWKLDTGGSTITDYGSGGNNGTNNGATQVTSDVLTPQPVNGVSTTLPSTALQQSDLQFDSPYSNYSLSFDGAGDYISGNINTPSSFTNLTISCWVKVNSFSALQNGIISSSTSSGAHDYENGFALEVRNDNKFRFKVSSGGNTTNWLVASDASITNQWYHIACVVTPTQLELFINGVSKGTESNSSLTPSFERFFIGSRFYSGAPADYFNGKIDETSMFDYSLSEAQVLEIYNNGRPNDLTTFSGTAPISWWRLGENAYFDNNSFVVPNSISGAPNGTGSGTITTMISADAPGTYANGVGENLDILDRVGDAALSTSNSQSYNMIPSDISPYVPSYVGLQTDNIYSMDFDGTNYFTASSKFDFIQQTAIFSISTWIKMSDNTSATNQVIAGTNYTGSNVGWQLWIDNRSSQSPAVNKTLKFHLWNSTTNLLAIDQVITDNNWNLITITGDGTTIRAYKNGSLLSTTQSISGSTSSTAFSDLRIGANTVSSPSVFFNGQIDEVAIWDTALNAGQIFNDLYQPTATATNKTADLVNNPNLPTPVAWYRMGD